MTRTVRGRKAGTVGEIEFTGGVGGWGLGVGGGEGGKGGSAERYEIHK